MTPELSLRAAEQLAGNLHNEKINVILFHLDEIILKNIQMKIWKPFTIVLSSILVTFPLHLANTCSWGYDMDESILSPFHSEVLDLPELFPFYYSEHFYNGDPNSDWSENG